VVISAAVYLCTFTLLWGTALPDYLAATGGHIQAGPPIGNLVYTVLCAAGACTVVLLAFQRSRRIVPSDRPAPLAASIG
jgi:hypothetical protein